MGRLTDANIILIKRKTRLEELIVRYNTINQAKFYIEHLGADFSDYEREDKAYKLAINEAHRQLELIGRVQIVDREFIPNFIFGKTDIVVVVGQDGLVANTLKYLTNQLLIGVNPDPQRWDGILLPFEVMDLKHIVEDTLHKRRQVKEISMAKAVLNDGQCLYAVNDLFIGQKTHVSSRYQIEIDGKCEPQSSSGIIVSTGLGSTGWLKSVMTGAAQIASHISGQNISVKQQNKLEWNSEALDFSVREPFASKTSKADLVFGRITKEKPLRLLSQMSENGVIFSDGIEADYLNFNSGVQALITVAEKKGNLVI